MPLGNNLIGYLSEMHSMKGTIMPVTTTAAPQLSHSYTMKQADNTTRVSSPTKTSC